MTQPASPPFSGIPQPVQGVTGGPPVLGGQLGNDPQTGNVVISPNPGNATQIRKGSSPQALQVYEYFNSNTDYARLSLNSQTGGPFQLAVETAPSTVVRDLQILSNRNLQLIATGAITLNGVPVPLSTYSALTNSGPSPLAAAQWSDLTPTAAVTFTPAQSGVYLVTVDGNGICGPTGAQLSIGLAQVPTSPTSPTFVTVTINSIVIVANTIGYMCAVGVAPLVGGTSYRLMGYASVAGCTATARANAVRIG